MKCHLKKILLGLMVGIGIMGAVSAQAQEKEWVRVGDYEVYYVPIGPMSTKVLLGTASTLDAVCQNVVVPWAASRANSVYRYDGEYRVSISGGKRTSKGLEWITCDYTNPANGRNSNAGAYFICNESMIDLDRPDGCYQERVKCEGGTINPQTGECEPAKACPADLVKDQNGNCTCPEGEELVRLWGENRCEPKCPENKERDENGDCVCSFGFEEDENGDCGCPEGFEPVQQSSARSTGAQQCVPKCDEGYVRRNGVCVKLPYEPYKNPAVCGKTSSQINDGRERLSDLGAVACDGLEKEDRGVCFWPESHIDQETGKPNWDDLDLVAQGIIQDCVVEHEKIHYNESGSGFYCNVYSRWATPLETSRSDSERRAYEAERACYMREIDRCGSSEACIKDIANEMSLVEQNLEALK